MLRGLAHCLVFQLQKAKHNFMLENLVDKLCHKLSKKLEKRIIMRRDGLPYLERYYILHSDRFKWIPGIYLHKFISSDEDPELHDHPWCTSLSFILTGGYREERRVGENVVTYNVLPGHFNMIKKSTFHRIDLLDKYAWTLFCSGNREQDWGFWNRDTKEYASWREHINRKNDNE